MMAVASHSAETVALLLEKGADVDVNMFAVSRGGHLEKRDFSHYLHAKRPRTDDEAVDAKDASGTGQTNKTTAGGFKKGGSKMTSKDVRLLEEEENAALEVVLGELEEMSSIYEYFSTPLMFAVFVEDAPLVAQLLKAGATVDALNGDDDTALTIAALIGRVDIVKCLLDAGAAIPTGAGSGRTFRNIIYTLTRRFQFSYLTRFVVQVVLDKFTTRKGVAKGRGGASKVKAE
jgi:hypothetical protein